MKHFYFIICCFWYPLQAFAQPKADFTADVRDGCSPVVVKFQNLSTGINDATEYLWNLGNGSLSTLKNPAASYLNPGIYTVSLRVTSADGKDSLTREAYIAVYSKPQIDFEVNIRTGCAPTAVRFTDQSIPAPGTANASWSWDFGDGTGATEQNPAHVYTTPGTYPVTLSITSDKGCGDLQTKTDYITISQGVIPKFTQTKQTVCAPPVNIRFTNTSTGPETLGYLWDFGNGKTSTELNPEVTYDTAGTYAVKLIVRSSSGCADSLLVPDAIAITATQIITNFHVPPICSDMQVQFSDSSSTFATSRLWMFSDGTTDTAANPVKTFTTPGTYAITLVNSYGTCTDSLTKNIEIGARPDAKFTASERKSCKLPLPVAFTNNSENGVSYQWNFGDGTGSTEKTPEHTYTKAGNYSVTLIATNASGCTDTLSEPAFVAIQQPVVYFKNLPERGCLPYSTQFFDSVISADEVVSYKWNLGDGTTATSKAPKHKYTKQGTYPVTLTIETATGCTATATNPKGIKVGTEPTKVDFTTDQTTVCASLPIRFTDSSQNVDEWTWDFGDGTSSSEKNPVHYFGNVGVDTVKLTVYNSGCKGEVIKKAVVIKPPIALFSYTLTSCSDRMTYSFVNSSLTGGLTTLKWLWNFGDGTTSELQHPGTHTFPDYGTYTVSLYVASDECSYTAQQTITIIPRTTDFSANQAGCKPFTTLFTPSDAGNPQVTAYTWYFGDGKVLKTKGAVNYTYTASGDYDVSLITTDIYGCLDTSEVKVKYIRVNGPVAKFVATNIKGCIGLTTIFTDQTTNDGQNAIQSWKWDFGDSSQQTFTAPPFEHVYGKAGWFSVKLTVQDAAGCRDSITIPEYVRTSDLKAAWTGVEKTCPGAPVQFTSAVNALNFSSVWDFGNGTTATEPEPLISYPDTGTYTIKLVVSDSLGCRDSLVRPYYTQVYRPVANFTENNLTSYCLPFQAQFKNASTYFISSYWELGVGTSTQLNPVSIYTQTGTYPVKLRVTSPGGCMDSLTKTLNVYDINSAKIAYGPLTFGCRPLTVNFDAFTELKGRFIWDFGDGAVVDTTINKISHTYENAATFIPKIILTEPSGCVIALTGDAPIKVNGARVKFGIDKKFFCDSGLVRIFDSTMVNGADAIYNWDFGDGTVSSDPNPGTHFYRAPGWHPLKLTVQTGEGCLDSMAIRPGVHISVTPHIRITGDSAACVNTAIRSIGVLDKGDPAAITWNWLFADGSTLSQQSPPDLQFTEPGNHPMRAIATNTEGCADTAYKNLVVYPREIGTAEFTSPITIEDGFPVKLEGTYPPNIKGYEWKPAAGLSCTDCPFPVAGPSVNTRYIVQYTDSNNCRNTATVQVMVLCKNASVFIPNTFSPNGDGSNDVFYVRGRGLSRVKLLRIFDRWGEVVFEKKDFAANDPSAGWNGRHKDANPKPDLYIYQAEVFCGNGEVMPFNGNIALIR